MGNINDIQVHIQVRMFCPMITTGEKPNFL